MREIFVQRPCGPACQCRRILPVGAPGSLPQDQSGQSEMSVSDRSANAQGQN
jgi:hypothetical protein